MNSLILGVRRLIFCCPSLHVQLKTSALKCSGCMTTQTPSLPPSIFSCVFYLDLFILQMPRPPPVASPVHAWLRRAAQLLRLSEMGLDSVSSLYDRADSQFGILPFEIEKVNLPQNWTFPGHFPIFSACLLPISLAVWNPYLLVRLKSFCASSVMLLFGLYYCHSCSACCKFQLFCSAHEILWCPLFSVLLLFHSANSLFLFVPPSPPTLSRVAQSLLVPGKTPSKYGRRGSAIGIGTIEEVDIYPFHFANVVVLPLVFT